MSQLSQVYQFCEKQQGYFRLAEAYEALPQLKQPTVRYYLQKARDKGLIRFVDNKGLYQR